MAASNGYQPVADQELTYITDQHEALYFKARRVELLHRVTERGNRGRVPQWLQDEFAKYGPTEVFARGPSVAPSGEQAAILRLRMILKNLLSIHRTKAIENPEVFLRELLISTSKERYCEWQPNSARLKFVNEKLTAVIGLFYKLLSANELAFILSYGEYPPVSHRPAFLEMVKQRAQDAVLHYYEHSKGELLTCLWEIDRLGYIWILLSDERGSRFYTLLISCASLLISLAALTLSAFKLAS